MPKCPICQNLQSQFFTQKKQYHYYFCNRCQIIFLFPLPSEKEMSQYYQKSFKYEAGLAEEKRIGQRAKIILKNLIKLNLNGKTLLDVGSGFGYFLEEAKKNNFKILGLEPSKELFLMNRFIKNIKNITFEDYFKKNNKKKFDFITLIHVIEHLNNPKQIIQSAIKLLNNNGILYIETPNLNSHLFRTEKENYTFLTPPDHLWIFSKKSLETMLRDISLIKIVKTSTYTHPEHLMGIIKRKFQMTSLKFQINTKTQNLNEQNKNIGTIKSIKYRLFDKTLAPLFTPLLNLGGYGSILELYIRKK
jgi:2-polyprenyl-3-methyl-5-hydroxy-6-metoxy-1,4-benzoquinol methylase